VNLRKEFLIFVPPFCIGLVCYYLFRSDWISLVAAVVSAMVYWGVLEWRGVFKRKS
jgi:hypothetical protein